MKKVTAIICIVMLTALLTVQCAVADPVAEEGPTQIPNFPQVPDVGREVPAEEYYSGPIDNFTGAPYGSTEEEIGGSRVYINSTTAYDRERHLYLMLNATTEVFSTAPDGIITTEPVSLVTDQSTMCALYRNGEPASDVDPLDIREPGAYVLQDLANDGREIMRFTIVGDVTGQPEKFEVPQGFAIGQVMYEGVAMDFKPTSVSMAQEGEYAISYYCPVTEMNFSFRTTVDHTPPQLQLLAVNEEGFAKGPVDISDLEPGAKIGIRRNGAEVSYAQTLTQRGEYVIVVEDEAGNLNTYQFAIRAYFNVNSIIFLVVILLLAAGVGGYVLYSRRHVRVR